MELCICQPGTVASRPLNVCNSWTNHISLHGLTFLCCQSMIGQTREDRGSQPYLETVLEGFHCSSSAHGRHSLLEEDPRIDFYLFLKLIGGTTHFTI